MRELLVNLVLGAIAVFAGVTLEYLLDPVVPHLTNLATAPAVIVRTYVFVAAGALVVYVLLDRLVESVGG